MMGCDTCIKRCDCASRGGLEWLCEDYISPDDAKQKMNEDIYASNLPGFYIDGKGA